jgi:hypothetical protein
MRFITKQKGVDFEKRIISKFLWLPKTLDGELRWLEPSKIRQVYLDVTGWRNIEWED